MTAAPSSPRFWNRKNSGPVCESFPPEALAALPLEKYAVGLGEGTLCYEYAEISGPPRRPAAGARTHRVFPAGDGAEAAVTPTEAFASIKKLQGDWRGPAMAKGMPPARSVFRVTAGGSAVEETIFPGSKMEMVSVYHMDKGSLLMTHYCMVGNQPRMKLNAAKSTAGDLVFDFDGGTNLNPRRDMHMHSLRLTLPVASKTGAQKLQTSGTSWEGGKEKAGSCSVTLTRRG